jgi:hypothetical protein
MQLNNSVSPVAAMSAAELNPQRLAQLLESDVDSDSDIDGLDNNDWDDDASNNDGLNNEAQQTLGDANADSQGDDIKSARFRKLQKKLRKLVSWAFPPVFQWLQQKGHIEQMEMYRTFNCGVGFVVVVPADKADQAIDLLNEQGETAWKLGEIVERQGDAVTYR